MDLENSPAFLCLFKIKRKTNCILFCVHDIVWGLFLALVGGLIIAKLWEMDFAKIEDSQKLYVAIAFMVIGVILMVLSIFSIVSLSTFKIKFIKKFYFIYRKVLSIIFFVLNIVCIALFVNFDKLIREVLVDHLKFTAKGMKDIDDSFLNILIGLGIFMFLSVLNVSSNQVLKDDLLSTSLDGDLNVYGQQTKKEKKEDEGTIHGDEEEEEAVIGF